MPDTITLIIVTVIIAILAAYGISVWKSSQTPPDPNQLAKSIALRPSRRLVELGLKAKPGKM